LRVTEILDTRGLRCPLPVLRTRERLKERAAGAVLEVLSDDPLAVLDMQAFCAKEGHEYLGHDEEPGPAWRLRVRKG
jgi:tRNA 2-thiouridine synthesizing protein A